ncbi:MAG TPA: hypothetical protein VIJ66_13145 [Solirubrobacteraceae bacterium]
MTSTGVRFPAQFDADAWERDLARSTPAGRNAAERAKRDYERSGVPREHLRRCEPEGRDGTNLPDCAKGYVPNPNGKWGIMFKIVVIDGRVRLEFLSFGVRHHPKGSQAPNVYDLAGERVAEITATDLREKT